MAGKATSRLDTFFPVKGNNSSRSVTSNRKYEGASHSKRTSGFPLNNLSPNKDIGMDATLLRQRSRYLYQNTPYAKRAINAIANGMVGTGIQPKVKTGSVRAQKTLKRLWKTFGETTMCDFNGRLDFYGLQKLISKTYKRDGECMILRRRVPVAESITGIQYQVLEMEYLADYINYQILPGGGYTINGIEYDKRGKALYYWLFQRHPSEWWTQPEKYPVNDICHILDVDYPGQNRGVPSAAPTIIAERDLDDYEDAEIVGKKVQASQALFRVTNDPEKMESPPNIDDYDKDEDLEKIEPGAIYHLFPGEQIQFNTPPTSPGAEDFRRSKQRNIAAGYEVTYEMMTGDLNNVNFSSGRMGWIEHQRSVEHWQWMTLIPTFCVRAFNWFLEQVPLTITSDISYLPDDIEVSWTTPRREMIDPVKETSALKMQMRCGLKSWSEVVRSQGDDPDDVRRQIIEDKKTFTDAKLHAEWLPDLDLPKPLPVDS